MLLCLTASPHGTAVGNHCRRKKDTGLVMRIFNKFTLLNVHTETDQF